jgi:class 3 adenylate cyclase/CheY-like chemotaxis protein
MSSQMETSIAAPGPDDLLFAPEEPQAQRQPSGAEHTVAVNPWRILIVDDEPEVHAITRLALADLHLDGRPLQLTGAADAASARELLLRHPDTAVILLDVVMEREHAGLELARWIREERGDRAIRIVLRTGQPGLAPEPRVMLDYDINDYRAKTELTAQRLVTTVIGALRSYRDIAIIDAQKAGLRRVIEATASLFERRSLEHLLSGLLTQLAGLFGPDQSAIFIQACGPLFGVDHGDPVIIAGTGDYSGAVGRAARDCLDAELLHDLELAIVRERPLHRPAYSLYAICRDDRSCAALYIETGGSRAAWEQDLLDLFCRNAAVALDNLRLHQRQRDLLAAFERFVPARLLGLLGDADVSRVRVGDHIQREVTVLFADLQRFTALAERLSPEATFGFLNDFYAAIIPAIAEHGGVVDKYLGDGLMALFPRAPQDAVAAALDLLERSRAFAAARPDLPLAPRLGVGVHTGPMILGVLGGADRLEFTAVSDSVNVAARVERLTRVFGVDLLISREVHDRLAPEHHQHTRQLGQVELRGKGRRVEIFEVFAGDPASARDDKAATKRPLAEVIQQMQLQRWPSARRGLAELRRRHPDDPVFDALDRHCERQLHLEAAAHDRSHP